MTDGRETGFPAAMRDLLDRGGIILTANARAARALDRRFAQSQQARGVTVWPTARILDLHSWLQEQWELLLLTGTEDRLLLNDVQEHALWLRILKPLLAERSLIEPSRMATQSREAYTLLVAYGAEERLKEPKWTIEPRTEPELFRSWALKFEAECVRRRWLPQGRLIGAVTHALRWGGLAPPPEIGWLGFDLDTPAQRELAAAIQTSGGQSRTLMWEIPQDSSPGVYPARSEGDEVTACAAWVRARLDAAPQARIGILMPDLANSRAQIEREFSRRLRPELFPITAGASPSLPFEFSLGQPLAQTPLVHAALLLLRWLQGSLLQQEISWLLLANILGVTRGDAARNALARWDDQLRDAKCAPPELSLEGLLRLSQNRSAAVDSLRNDLSTVLQAHRRASRATLPGEWVQRIRNLLRLAGWGDRADASSLHYQTLQAWELLLDSVASLDIMAQSLPYTDFLTILDRAARETIFAPESEDAPVQIMGAYAASGQSFDAVWFLGATDTAWPAAGRPHPLLPLALQREFDMPHTSASSDQALAHRVTERIIESAGAVVFSYAVQAADSLQRSSALIASFAVIPITAVEEQPATVPLDYIADDTWVPIEHTGVTPGGQTALKRQAACPFQAFVFHRLRVRELRIAGRGLSAMDRGRLLHEILQDVWSRDTPDHKHLNDHKELHAAMHGGTLRQLITAHAVTRARALGADTSERWQRAYLDAERERAIDLAMEWLTYECKRQPFAVAAVEKKIGVHVGKLSLDVRADRIDRVCEGQLLIDYKTGNVTPASWDGARPKEPQLPLYAAFGNVEELVGTVFAQVRPAALTFKGRVADAQKNLSIAIKGSDTQIKPYTAELAEEWRDVLVQLADSFVRGDAQVDPHFYPKTCEFCPLPGVCRVAELRASGAIHASVDDEDDAE